jgi:preprotein translocase subunit SecE
MNRQTKRLLQRQGQIDAEGLPQQQRERAPRQQQLAQAPGAGRRNSPAQFLREVRVELRKVAWPTRAETVNYSTVVLLSLVVLIALIFILDYAFGKASLFLFK